MNHVYDVLIVGAGPVGLATAIALYRRGIENILVIDRARSFRPVGQVVDILPNGLKALRYIDQSTYQGFLQRSAKFISTRQEKSKGPQPQAVKKRFWYFKNLQGKITRTIPLDPDYWLENYGERRTSLPWHQLQSHLKNALPPEIVQANHRCINISQTDQSVVINWMPGDAVENPFAPLTSQPSSDGTNLEIMEQTSNPQPLATKTLEAKIVVAADGINSTVRQLMYQDTELAPWAKPQYSGFGAIGCFHIEPVSESMVQGFEEQYLQGQMVVTVLNNALDSPEIPDSPRFILIRRGPNALGYLLHATLPLEALQNRSPQDLINAASRLLHQASFPPLFAQLVQCSNPAQLIHRPYNIHPANLPPAEPIGDPIGDPIGNPIGDPIWSQGRVVLVGDAAHGMPPFAAQGANQGLEDAAVIGSELAQLIHANQLDNLALIAQKFQQYEQLRRPFMAQIQRATLHNHTWSQAEWEDYSDRVYGREMGLMESSK